MRNHVHLVATPEKEDSLALAIGRTNLLYEDKGLQPLAGCTGGQATWGRIASSRVRWMTRISRRRCGTPRPITCEPASCARRGSTRSPAPRSIAAGRPGAGVPALAAWRQMLGKQGWIEVLTEDLDETETQGLRLNTHTGRPLGSDGFVSKLERFVGHRPRPLHVGRPKSRKEE
jgi:hypothetical protein